MSRPLKIDTSDWGPFDPKDPADVMCERERHAFTEYLLRRLRKAPKTGSTEAEILTGAMMSIAQLAWAMHAGSPPDRGREALHDTIDFCWLQCAGMAFGKDRAN